MNIICEITDMDILSSDGRSNAQPRYTARAILKRSDGMCAVMYAEKFNLHSLPGGGIENDEDSVTALKRELSEETGCECMTINEIGCIYENRAHCDFTQYSYYYYVITDGQTQKTHLTQNEIKNDTGVQWYSLDKVIELITTPIHCTNQRKFIQAKDTAALNEYIKKYIC